MSRKPSQTRRRRPAARSAVSPDAAALGIGPPPRAYYVDWAEREAALLARWNRDRDAILAEWAPERPWGYFWYDRPHGDTIPGLVRDAHLAAGRLTSGEAARMESAHTAHAFARVAASRPAQSTADWLADPALVETTIALVGWNPFSEPVIAHLRREYRSDVDSGADARGAAHY